MDTPSLGGMVVLVEGVGVGVGAACWGWSTQPAPSLVRARLSIATQPPDPPTPIANTFSCNKVVILLSRSYRVVLHNISNHMSSHGHLAKGPTIALHQADGQLP